MGFMATTDSSRSSEALVAKLACSFLHQRAARPKILPCTKMVKGILDSNDIKTGSLGFKVKSSQNHCFHKISTLHPLQENTQEAKIALRTLGLRNKGSFPCTISA